VVGCGVRGSRSTACISPCFGLLFPLFWAALSIRTGTVVVRTGLCFKSFIYIVLQLSRSNKPAEKRTDRPETIFESEMVVIACFLNYLRRFSRNLFSWSSWKYCSESGARSTLVTSRGAWAPSDCFQTRYFFPANLQQQRHLHRSAHTSLRSGLGHRSWEQ